MVGGLALWGIWYKLVLQPATKQVDRWGPRWLGIFLSSGLYKWVHWYQRKVTNEHQEAIARGSIKKGKQYLLVWHPHGSFTIGALYIFSHLCAKDIPFKFCVVVADLLFRVPGLCEYLLLCNARSGSRDTFDALLAAGYSVAVQPGGLIEQVKTDSDKEVLYFPKKLGFIRLAMKHGVPLLPCYCFGENQLFPTKAWTRKLNYWFYKALGTGSLVVYGRCGLPNSPVIPNPLLLPDPTTEMHVRYGEHVDVGPPDADPSEEKVLEVFERYKTALRRLFDENKDTCLRPEVAAHGLEIIWRGAEPAAESSKKK